MKVYIETNERWPVAKIEEEIPEVPGIEYYRQFYPDEPTYIHAMSTSSTMNANQMVLQKTATQEHQEAIEFVNKRTIELTLEELAAIEQAELEFNKWQQFLLQKIDF